MKCTVIWTVTGVQNIVSQVPGLFAQYMLTDITSLQVSPSFHSNLAFFQELKGCSGFQPYN